MKSTIRPIILSDNSVVYDLEIPIGYGVITLAANSHFAALDLQKLIEKHVVAANFQ